MALRLFTRPCPPLQHPPSAHDACEIRIRVNGPAHSAILKTKPKTAEFVVRTANAAIAALKRRTDPRAATGRGPINIFIRRYGHTVVQVFLSFHIPRTIASSRLPAIEPPTSGITQTEAYQHFVFILLLHVPLPLLTFLTTIPPHPVQTDAMSEITHPTIKGKNLSLPSSLHASTSLLLISKCIACPPYPS
jgi:hypothetical protein